MDIQTLQQAQSFCKKHKKFKEELNIHSVIDSGKKLLSDSSYLSDVVEDTAVLNNAWSNLLPASELKVNQLKLFLTAHQSFP